MTFGYIGSKYNLLEFIDKSVSNHVDLKDKSFGDLFAGTGVVGEYFKNKYNCNVSSNDMELYSYTLNVALLQSSYSDKLQIIIDKLNKSEYTIEYEKLITETYCSYNGCERKFFSVENGLKIDYCMNVINSLEIDDFERCFILAV